MPSLFKRSNCIYHISFEEIGRRRWISTGERYKATALKELLTFEKSRRISKPKIRLQTFITEFLTYAEATYSSKTLTIYKSALGHFLSLVGDRLVISITPKDVDLYRTDRLKNISEVSVNVELRTLRAAFYTAVRWKLLSENPFKKVSLLRVADQQPVYLSREDFQRLVSLIGEEWLRDLIILAVSTGFRRAELIKLTWIDADFQRQVIHVQSSEGFRTKAGKRRVVPMSQMVYQLLCIGAQRSVDEYVFTFNGRRISESLVTHKFKRCVRGAGLNPKLHFHSLRHTFATWLVQEGMPIYEVQKLLGHSSISVTQVYSHLAASELHRAVNKIQVVMN